MKTAAKRRHYLVNKPLQLGFAFFLVWVLAVAVVITWLLTYFITWNGIINNISLVSELPQLIRTTNTHLVLALAASTTTLICLSVWIHVYLSHRIAGPAYRIEKILGEIARGARPEQVSTRPNDYLKEITGEINHLLTALRRDNAESGARLREVIALLEQAGAGGPQQEVKLRQAIMFLEKIAQQPGSRETAGSFSGNNA